jgi:hypothetical protein
MHSSEKYPRLRSLFLVFYEDLPSLRCRTMAGLRQRRQKRGLREALARYGPVRELDYRLQFKRRGRLGLMENIRRAAEDLQVDLILSELHGDDMLTAADVKLLRWQIPEARWVNWNGDYRDLRTIKVKDADLMANFDLALFVCQDQVNAYADYGVNSNYWQVGWEPDSFGCEPTRWTAHHDVLFQANCYSQSRLKLVEALRESGFELGVYGKGWPWFRAKGNTLYDYRAGCRLTRRAKIVLSDSQWPQADGYVSNRLFEAMAAGGALVMQQAFKGYERLGFVDGEHFVIWEDIADLIAKLRYWLLPENEARGRAVAAAGQKFCLEHHSFDVRVRELLGMIAQLKETKVAG